MEPGFSFNLNPFPRMEGERIVLRELEMTDVEDLFSLRTDLLVNEFLLRQPPRNREEVRAKITELREGVHAGKWGYWALALSSDPRLLGTVCLFKFTEDRTAGDIGFELHPRYHRKGLMSEAVKLVLKFGFQSLGLKEIRAWASRHNQASLGLLQKHGFQFTGRKPDPEYPEDIHLALPREVWESEYAAAPGT